MVATIGTETSSRVSTPMSKIEDREPVRLRVSFGGRFSQDESTGIWKYVGGETFLESIPISWGYADLVHSLAEKSSVAVSVKYQLPGEDLDPDALISLTDDSDVAELFDEYFRALQLPGTPLRTFRVRIFLFQAAEDVYISADPESSSGNQLFLQSSGHTSSSPGSNQTETELAWEAGFIAGQEAAAASQAIDAAEDDEWLAILAERLASMSHADIFEDNRSVEDDDENFHEMFDTKYEHTGSSLSTPSKKPPCRPITGKYMMMAGTPEPTSGGKALAARLPSHIPEFEGNDACTIISPTPLRPFPPDAAHLPTSFDLLGAAMGSTGISPIPSKAPSPRPPMNEALLAGVPRIDASQVHVVAKVGEGAFGEVSLAECPNYGTVAVKWIKPSQFERHWSAFWREADLMSRLNHPNILRFYGLVVDDQGTVVGIMTEFAAGGSLASMNSGGAFPLLRRSELALGAAQGLAYLHSQKVVHFDVKPDNLLVDDKGAVKVADFGLSIIKYNTFCSGVQDLRGTLPYMAPEMITNHKRVTEKADVWSLGVVLWEMLTGEAPHADAAPATLIGALGSGGARLIVPDWCEPQWRALMEGCWVVDPESRPTMRVIVRQLERLVRDAASSATLVYLKQQSN